MYRFITISMIALITLTGCSSSEEDDWSMFEDLDVDLMNSISGANRYVVVSLVPSCTSDNVPIDFPASAITVIMSCEGYRKLMVDNTPPNVCDEITIKDKYGYSFTGFFNSASTDEACN